MILENFDKAIITIGKNILATLPADSYKGKICVIDNPEKVKSAVEEIRTADIIGFDTETRPSFKKGQQYNVALIQLATQDCVYLFRTSMIGYPQELINLLEDPDILKVGLSLHDDFHNLRRVVSFEPQGFIDLQNFVKDFKIVDNSLSRLYGILFGKRLSKAQRLSNWEAIPLSESQKQYASLDAYSCIKIYNYLKEGKFDPMTSEYLTLPPEPEEAKEDKEE